MATMIRAIFHTLCDCTKTGYVGKPPASYVRFSYTKPMEIKSWEEDDEKLVPFRRRVFELRKWDKEFNIAKYYEEWDPALETKK